jgi:uncharacterized protein with HEPN domain
MSPDSATDLATLGDVITACLRVMDFTRGAAAPTLIVTISYSPACCHRIAVIGEAVKRLSRRLYPDVPWRDIAGMRDRLIHGYDIHGYDSVDLEELCKTSTEDIPVLLAQVRKI